MLKRVLTAGQRVLNWLVSRRHLRGGVTGPFRCEDSAHWAESKRILSTGICRQLGLTGQGLASTHPLRGVSSGQCTPPYATL